MGPLGVLQCLPRMLVSRLVVPFFVVRRCCAVSVRGKIVVFSSFPMRIFHSNPSVAASHCSPETRRKSTTSPNHAEEMLGSTIHQQRQRAMSKCEQTTKNVSV